MVILRGYIPSDDQAVDESRDLQAIFAKVAPEASFA
jgi:hypothetical protein